MGISFESLGPLTLSLSPADEGRGDRSCATGIINLRLNSPTENIDGHTCSVDLVADRGLL